MPPERVVSYAADAVRIVLHQQRDGSMVEQYRPAAPGTVAVAALANDLVTQAANSLRVRARLLGAQLREAVR